MFRCHRDIWGESSLVASASVVVVATVNINNNSLFTKCNAPGTKDNSVLFVVVTDFKKMIVMTG